jgi:RNA polymerase sigma factor (sigma-70 family)
MEAQSLPRNGRLFLPRSPRVLGALGDEKLVEQVRRGNEAAFEAVYDRHHRGILSFCRHMLGSPDEAEDAVQQVFMSAYDALHSDRRDIRLKPWLYAIARNRCLSILRARREEPAEIEDVPTAGLSEEVQQRSDLRALLHDLHELPVDQRAALVLSEVGGLSHSEVGAVVGCEVAKVKSLVFQARSSLIESRKAREIPCTEIREQLATATGGALRRGPLRRHLRSCAGCAEFRDEVTSQRKALAALLPVVPTLGLKKSALAGIGLGGGGGGGAAVGLGGGIASFTSTSAAVKLTVVTVVAGVAVGGGLIIQGQSPAPEAEAAGGAGGGGQAWPAPPAGTGPGAIRLTKRPVTRDAAARRPSAKSAPHGGSAPGRRHQTSRHGEAPRVGGVTSAPSPSHGHSGGGGSTPTPAVPTPNAPATTPPPVDTSHGHGGGSHTNNGNHYGWEQGVGNPHSESGAEHHESNGGGHEHSGGDGGGDHGHGGGHE